MRVKNDYPPDWSSRSERVKKRDGYTCQNCGRKGGPHGDATLNAHHIVPKSKGGTHKMSNLTTECKGCHEAIHYGNKIAPTVQQSNKKTVTWRHVVSGILAYVLFYATAKISEFLGGNVSTFIIALGVVVVSAIAVSRLVQVVL